MLHSDNRSGKIVLLAHCILNQNARVQGLAYYEGMISEVVNVLQKHGVGIIQMPCPETTYAGLRRPPLTKEQYDTPMYRRHCTRIAYSLASQIQEYLKNGFKVLALLGVEGSPTCDITTGILMEELKGLLEKRNVSVPMRNISKQINEDVAWLEKTLSLSDF
ncbi:MAG: hypothetical protein QXE76_05565 [Candidatus Bathyarchaeia archaeon]